MRTTVGICDTFVANSDEYLVQYLYTVLFNGASACLSMQSSRARYRWQYPLSVRPSVRPSNAGIKSKRLHTGRDIISFPTIPGCAVAAHHCYNGDVSRPLSYEKNWNFDPSKI